MENIVPRKRIFPRKTTYPAILFPFSLCVGKGREACSPRLIVRVIRNSGGNSESNRSATAAKEARRRRKKGRGGKRARKNGILYSAPSWGKSHASRFYEYSHFRAWGRPTGKASLSPRLIPPPHPNNSRFFLPAFFFHLVFSSLRSLLSREYECSILLSRQIMGRLAIRLAMFKAIFVPARLLRSTPIT